jgi:catechol 2,3-dioxygenase-like lactoylglutathione lyase family enzyme
MIDLKNCSTALFVKNITISKEFYCGLPGLTIDMDFGKNVIFKNGFAIWEIQNDHIITKKLGVENLTSLKTNRFELYFETDNLTEICQYLLSRNTRFLHTVHEEPWGQLTIRFFDPDNHLIEIGESMKQFVCRLYNQGLTAMEVSEKTSVPLNEVIRLIKPDKPL